MKRTHVLIAALASLGATAAPAQANPSMSFLSAPAVREQGVVQRTVMQSRAGDRMVVVVKEPAACGARPAAPRLALNDGVLHVGFSLPPTTTPACVATAVFTVKGLPSEPVSVLADADDATAAPARADHDQALAVKFIGGEARPVEGIAEAAVRQVRNGGQLVAVVTQPAACGTRLSDPAVALDETDLALRYGAAASSGATPSCAATAVFSVKGLPSRELTAVARPSPLAQGAQVASPTEGAAGPAPKMSFVAAPAIPAAAFGSLRNVVQVRSGDAMSVIIHEPAACGARPERASFKLEGWQLRLNYRMPKAQNPATGCVATAMVTFRGLPAHDIRVVAVSGSAPDGTLAMVWPQATSD